MKVITTFKVIVNLSDERLKQAHMELIVGLPKGNASVVRSIQADLYYENNKTVPMVNTQYRIAMEMIRRFL